MEIPVHVEIHMEIHVEIPVDRSIRLRQEARWLPVLLYVYMHAGYHAPGGGVQAPMHDADGFY